MEMPDDHASWQDDRGRAMTILALVSGSLFRAPERRVAKSGNSYVVTTLRTKDTPESRFIRVSEFSETAQAELLRLADGDGVSVQGDLRADIYNGPDGTARVSLSMFANGVLALRQPPRKRRSKADAPAADTRSRQDAFGGSWSAESGDFNDDIGF
jgi:single-stranded DNA-binding protein